MLGHLVSRASVSREKRFSRRPVGCESKKDMGILITCGDGSFLRLIAG